MRVLDGPLSAASALKMSYAGITKGTQALGAAMMLAARAAVPPTRCSRNCSESQPEMLAWLQRSLSIMPPKAYRWIAEMHEIADFVGEDPAAHELYTGAAHFYEQIARDFETDKKEVAALRRSSTRARRNKARAEEAGSVCSRLPSRSRIYPTSAT